MPDQRGLSDDEVTQWLEVLRSGNRDEKIQARLNLADVCLSRGMVPEAIELLELNAQDGVKEPALFRRLANLYREVGRVPEADEAEATAASLEAAYLPNKTVSVGNADVLPQDDENWELVGKYFKPRSERPKIYDQPPSLEQPRKNKLTTTWAIVRYILIVPSVTLAFIMMVLLNIYLVELIPNGRYFNVILPLLFVFALDLILPIIVVGLACVICPSKNQRAPIIITSIFIVLTTINTLLEMKYYELNKPAMFYFIDIGLQVLVSIIICLYFIGKYTNRRLVRSSLKRMAIAGGAAVIGFVGTHIMWFIMGLMAYVPILGWTYSLILWGADLWWGWIGSWIGLSAVNLIAILTALRMGIEAWEGTDQPAESHY